MFSLGRKTYIQTGFGTAIPPSLPATLIGGLSPKSFPFSFTWPAPTDVSSVSFLSTKLGVEIHGGPGPSSYLGLLVLTRIFETVACPLLNSIRAAGTDPGWGLGGGWISIRCPELRTLQRMRPAAGLVSTRARVIQEAWGAGGEEAWTGRGLNVFIWGWQSYPPQRPWRQPHWCRWVRGGTALGDGEARGEAPFLEDPSPAARRFAGSGCRCEAPRRKGPHWKGVWDFSGRWEDIISGKETGTGGLRRET